MKTCPPGSEASQLVGGDACTIVMLAGDTIVEGLYRGTTKDIQKGQTVTTYAYPTGAMDVANKIGGKFHHLEVVGVIANQ